MTPACATCGFTGDLVANVFGNECADSRACDYRVGIQRRWAIADDGSGTAWLWWHYA